MASQIEKSIEVNVPVRTAYNQWTQFEEFPHFMEGVTFHRLRDDRTKIMLQMDYDPEGFVENTGDLLGVASLRVKGDLERSKEFIESRGRETGGWRGEVRHNRT